METKALQNYLEQTVEARKHLNANHESMRKPKGFKYVCFEEFVLNEGRIYEEFSPRASRYQPGIPKNCFTNAFLAASRSRGNLRYVEGFAYGTILPVLHGWNIDSEDRIVDVTWYEGGVVSAGEAYMGVVFDLDEVREVRKNGYCSVIDNWTQGFPVLQENYRKD